MNALQALVTAIVDYAGLFPPAGLDMARAVRSYAEYRASDDAWMLGRFVVPVGRLDEFCAARAAMSDDGQWPLSALIGEDVANDVARAAALNAVPNAGATIETVEARISARDDVAVLAALPVAAFTVFGELPYGVDAAPLLAALRQAGFNAKLRTGGVTADSFPPAEWLARTMRACIHAGVPFKATAGLHHPMRGCYRLTYADDAPTGAMFGYLNVFLAAAFLANGMTDGDAIALLTEQRVDAFAMASDAIRWRDHTIGVEQIRAARDRVAISFGSCSFREPVDELRRLAPLA